MTSVAWAMSAWSSGIFRCANHFSCLDEPTIACSLDAQDYRERLASIRRLGEEALLDVKTRPDGAALSFQDSDQVRAELASIVEAEAACCSYLDMSVRSERERLILTIVAPPDAMPVVRDMTASFRGAQTPERTTASGSE